MGSGAHDYAEQLSHDEWGIVYCGDDEVASQVQRALGDMGVLVANE